MKPLIAAEQFAKECHCLTSGKCCNGGCERMVGISFRGHNFCWVCFDRMPR